MTTDQEAAWPERPWILAAIGALGALIFSILIDHDYETPLSIAERAGATFTAVTTAALLFTLERRRWSWSLGFALVAGVVMALVGWSTASYNDGRSIFDYPYFSGLFAVLVAAPFFQAARDEGRLVRDFAPLHHYGWTDAVIGFSALLFTGLTFALLWMLAALFDSIGIDVLRDLLENEQAAWAIAGFAFGGAVGMLRERDRLFGGLLKLVMVVLAVLAPLMAITLALFLVALPITGFARLWESGLPETPLLLASAAWGLLLANAVFGTGEGDEPARPSLKWSAFTLTLVILPLALLAAVSMGLRIEQYGWTPDRLWGAIVIALALAYGFAAAWAAWKGRGDFAPFRRAQVSLGFVVVGLALFLALPILDFGAISTRSQLARLESGEVTPARFDYRAMAFDFGPEGRAALERLKSDDRALVAELATKALQSDNRWELEQEIEVAAGDAQLDETLILVPENLELSRDERRAVARERFCSERPCIVTRLEDGGLLIVGRRWSRGGLVREVVTPEQLAETDGPVRPSSVPVPEPKLSDEEMRSATVEVREEVVRRVYVNGEPVGATFE
ncbi:DUF4153 domain-containing protein [Sphingomicrobium arenosum]|uniref:DUF4153 domain-containing protein n=1 Tax=Sphingomicrobium arenosum TaxID=2233861 RepID=UPI00223FA184|nr:DUF4153 domain-containing protein [Sphingomicrobium arenosum]